ncbi:MAG: UDP-N-acetylmuramoyl-L-alanine--D-glutamate ligase [Gammaproteobacteria bacterium]|nr:UDP-N-acetylmuramoyl-L-alanine--D-glutamate ligase [Gammaproteobacteria bacterium]
MNAQPVDRDLPVTTRSDPEWRRGLRARLGFDGVTLVVGLGLTGLSCARLLRDLGLPVEITDNRAEPPGADVARRELADVPLHLGEFSAPALERCARILLSPGVAQEEPYVRRARDLGLPVLGDIELFARCADAPVAAITGSNGKSTVTALVGAMARADGRDVRVGGNIGTPALDLLQAAPPELYVLELSSFQLEATASLNPRAAVVLNLSPDHLDRYPDMQAYLDAKLRIHAGDGVVVVNRDDPSLRVCIPARRHVVSFGAGVPAEGEYGLVDDAGRTWLALGDERLIALDDLGLRGSHNALNALAALVLGAAVGLSRGAMLTALRTFTGLPHRTQLIGERRGVRWFNDSKGTNVGATLAALGGLPGRVVLIAGGLGKGQDFSPLRELVAAKARAVVLIGRDAPLIEAALDNVASIHYAGDMHAAVARAATLARPGDSVLLSPACASFDMFQGYEDRGRRFVAAFEEMAP